MRACLIALVVAVFTAGASAVPSLVTTAGTAPDGKNQYTLSLDALDGNFHAYGAELTFTPQAGAGNAIQQVKYGALDIKFESDAISVDGTGSPTYYMGNDTWAETPFVDVLTGIDETLPNYELKVGSPAGSTYNDVDLLQIVFTGYVDYTGYWAYGGSSETLGADINVSGTLPEPMNLCFLGAGGLALLRRRRR